MRLWQWQAALIYFILLVSLDGHCLNKKWWYFLISCACKVIPKPGLVPASPTNSSRLHASRQSHKTGAVSHCCSLPAWLAGHPTLQMRVVRQTRVQIPALLLISFDPGQVALLSSAKPEQHTPIVHGGYKDQMIITKNLALHGYTALDCQMVA